VIGQTIRASGMVGHGVISSPASLPLPRAHDVRAPRPARGHRPAALGVPAARDRGQPLAVRTIEAGRRGHAAFGAGR
jgi:hypothetical protein